MSQILTFIQIRTNSSNLSLLQSCPGISEPRVCQINWCDILKDKLMTLTNVDSNHHFDQLVTAQNRRKPQLDQNKADICVYLPICNVETAR